MKKLLMFTLVFIFGSTIGYTQYEVITDPEFSKKPLPAKGEEPKQTPEQAKQALDIINKTDRRESYPSARINAEMIVRENNYIKKQKMVIYARGDVDTLMKMTDGEAKNQKILRTETDIYVYFPDLDQQLRLSGASLRQGIVGSDVSYEDLTSIKKTAENFNVYLLGEDTANGYDCWVLYLVEKKNRVDKKTGKRKPGEAYPVQRIWVDKKAFTEIRSERYSRSQKLLKLSNTLSYKIMEGFVIPTHFVLQDKLKKNTSTTMKFNDILLHANISDRTFSLESLTF